MFGDGPDSCITFNDIVSRAVILINEYVNTCKYLRNTAKFVWAAFRFGRAILLNRVERNLFNRQISKHVSIFFRTRIERQSIIASIAINQIG